MLVNSGNPPAGGYTATAAGDPDGVANNRTNVVVAPGDVFTNADFGYVPPPATTGTVSGTLWLDADADQIGPAGTPTGTDTTEPTLSGVTVSLISDTNGNGIWDAGEPIIATDVTDAGGNYSFPGVPAGAGQDYLVLVRTRTTCWAACRRRTTATGSRRRTSAR